MIYEYNNGDVLGRNDNPVTPAIGKLYYSFMDRIGTSTTTLHTGPYFHSTGHADFANGNIAGVNALTSASCNIASVACNSVVCANTVTASGFKDTTGRNIGYLHGSVGANNNSVVLGNTTDGTWVYSSAAAGFTASVGWQLFNLRAAEMRFGDPSNFAGNFVVKNTNGQMVFKSDRTFQILNSAGTVLYETSTTQGSDARLKDAIVDLDTEASVDIISQLRPITYRYNEVSGMNMDLTHVGFIAQEVEELEPDAVVDASSGDGGVTKLLYMERLVPHLVNTIQSLLTRVAALEKIP